MGKTSPHFKTHLLVLFAVALALAAAFPALAFAGGGTTVTYSIGSSSAIMQDGVTYDFGGGSAKYVASAKELQLDGVNLKGCGLDANGNRNALSIDGDITIKVTGINDISQTSSAATDACTVALYIDGNATIAGEDNSTDTLSVSVTDNTGNSAACSKGIWVTGNLTIHDCAVYSPASKAAQASYGIEANTLKLDYAVVEAVGGDVTNLSTLPKITTAQSAGIMSHGSFFASTSEVNARSGDVCAAGDGTSTGVMLNGACAIDQCLFDCTSGNSIGNTGGIAAGILSTATGSRNALLFQNSNTTCSANTADNLSAGILATNVPVTFAGNITMAAVTSISWSTNPATAWTQNYGVYSTESINVEGGSVTAGAKNGGSMSMVPTIGLARLAFNAKCYTNLNDSKACFTSHNAAKDVRDQGAAFVGNGRVIITEANTSNLVRLSGNEAADTAAAISSYSFNTSDWVIVARDDDFADAMSASGLAGALNCPIILTNRLELSSAAQSEIERLHATNVYLIGGTGAIKDQVQTSLENLGVTVERVWGNACYDTSVACAQKIKQHVGQEAFANTDAIVTMSRNFQDALSISPLAYTYCMPIYLEKDTDDYALPAEAVSMIKTQNGNIWVPGGPGAVPTETVEGVFKGRTIHRIYGETGYDTSNELAVQLTQTYGLLDVSALCIANGALELNGSDALAGAALAGKAGAPLILVSAQEGVEALDYTTIKGKDSQGATAYLKELCDAECSPYVTYLLGGTYVLPKSFENTVRTMAGYSAS